MRKLLRYLMQVIYARNLYGRYRIEGWGYFRAVLGASFFVSITLFLFLTIVLCIFPDLYRAYLSMPTNNVRSIIIILFYMLISGFTVSSIVKKEEVQHTDLTRKQVDRAVNYFLIYLFAIGVFISILVMKFLAPIANNHFIK